MIRQTKALIFFFIINTLPLQLFAEIKNKIIGDYNDLNGGFYIGFNVGTGYLPSEDFIFPTWTIAGEDPTAGITINATVPFNNNKITNKSTYDFIGSVTTGYMMSNYLQFELEGGVTMSPKLKVKNTTISAVIDDGNGNIVPSNESIIDNTMGKTRILFGLISSYFNINISCAFMPYIGIGGGFAHYKANLSDSSFNKNFLVKIYGPINPSTGNPIEIAVPLDDIIETDTTKNTGIFHITAGANIMTSDNLMLGLGYRFLKSIGKVNLETSKNNVINNGNGTYTVSGKIEHQFTRHLVMFNAKVIF